MSALTYRLLLGDVREQLRTLPADSVQCVVTSPPYWGLRDYGVPGQLGLEETPEAFCQVMVEVFREVRRVLRPDGTLWLNLGDSYAGSWGAQGRQGKTGALAGRSIVAARQISAAAKRERGTGLPTRWMDCRGLPVAPCSECAGAAATRAPRRRKAPPGRSAAHTHLLETTEQKRSRGTANRGGT